MASPGNTNPWSQYDTYKDCSQGLCSLYCPQWCYISFPPPPPSFFLDDDSSSSSDLSPLFIALIGILASSFILITYYTLISKYCHRRSSSISIDHTLSSSWQQGNTEESPPVNNGLDESLIKSITVYKYKKGDGFIESSDCSVCLSEFRDEERLRLLPECKHAFHVTCIDTWLKSHSNCPLCRAFIFYESITDSNIQPVTDIHNRLSSDDDDDSVVVDLDLETRSRNETVSNGSTTPKPPELRDGVSRRSASVNAGNVVLIADILREIEEEDEEAGVGTSRRVEDGEGEKTSAAAAAAAGSAANNTSGVSSFIVTTGKFVISSYDRARNYCLPN